jgi:hypothetical protein
MSNIIAVPLNKLTYPSAIKGPMPFTDADADLLPTACRQTADQKSTSAALSL